MSNAPEPNPSDSASTFASSPSFWNQNNSTPSDSPQSSLSVSTPSQPKLHPLIASTSHISPSYMDHRTRNPEPKMNDHPTYDASAHSHPTPLSESPQQQSQACSSVTPSLSRSDSANRGLKRKGSPSDYQPNQAIANSTSQTDLPSSTANTKSTDTKSNEKPSGKRIKTARACDSCRRKKIRCDVIDDGGPPIGSPNNGNGGLVCAHCRQYGFECTFFLPITETRFKKKREREAEEAAAVAAVASARMGMAPVAFGLPHPAYAQSAMMASQPLPPPYVHVPMPPIRQSQSQEWIPKPEPPPHLHPHLHPISQSQLPPTHNGVYPDPQVSRQSSGSSHTGGLPTSGEVSHASSRTERGPPASPPPESRVLGPTSIAYIVHSTAFVPGAAIEAHNIKHNQTFEVGASGDGIIRFHKPRKQPGVDTPHSGDDDDITYIPESIKGRLAGDVAEKLVNTYFEKVSSLFPVVTKSEFVHLSPPPPLLLYAICGVAALNRQVPREVLGAVKTTLNALFRENDFLSNSSSVTVRALLILSLHSDLHGSTAVQAGSRCWNRTGSAIRMAQDLGLHRDASGKDNPPHDAYFLEQKRRIWGCCVTADRVLSISLGHPLMIDLTDCDVRLPSPYEILRSPNDLKSDAINDRPFAFNTEMLKLMILFGRVMKTIYSPTGLMKATDEEITSLLSDIDSWKGNLPVELQFGGADSSAPAGILHIGFACLMMLFFRVFMRISYICPTHFSFSLTIERMTSLIKYSAEAIAWVDKNDFYFDTLQIVSYCLVFCATVQYHAWVRRGDHNALALLKTLKEIVMRYKSGGIPEDDLTVRSKTVEVISLLCDCAAGAYPNSPCSGQLNPTAGVTNRKTRENLRGIVFKPDASRSGGGVYVVSDRNMLLRDLPKGTIIYQETENGNRIPAIVRTSIDQNGGWQTYDQYRAALAASAKQGMNEAQAIANMPTLIGGSNGMMNGTNAIMNHPANLPTAAATLATTSEAQNSNQVGGAPVVNFSSTSNHTGLGLAPPENLTHLAGDVWQDAEGRPVSRRGSKLVTMVPINGAAGSNFGPGLLPAGGTQLQVARNLILPTDPNFNFNPHLNDGYWAPAEFLFDNNTPAGTIALSGAGMDSTILDGLPGEPLDFDNWDAFFSKFNQPTVPGNNQDPNGSSSSMPTLTGVPAVEQDLGGNPPANSNYPMPSFGVNHEMVIPSGTSTGNFAITTLHS